MLLLADSREMLLSTGSRLDSEISLNTGSGLEILFSTGSGRLDSEILLLTCSGRLDSEILMLTCSGRSDSEISSSTIVMMCSLTRNYTFKQQQQARLAEKKNTEEMAKKKGEMKRRESLSILFL